MSTTPEQIIRDPSALSRGESFSIKQTPEGGYAVQDLVYTVHEGAVSAGRVDDIIWVFPEFGSKPEVQVKINHGAGLGRDVFLEFEFLKSIGLKKVDPRLQDETALQEAREMVKNLPKFTPIGAKAAGIPILKLFLNRCGINFSEEMIERIARSKSPSLYFFDSGLATIDYELNQIQESEQSSFVN